MPGWSAAVGTSRPPSTSTPNCTGSRPDARVVIHNHPYYVSVLAALGRLPELVHQTGSLFLDDMYLVETYDGEIDSPWRAAELAARSVGQPGDPGQPRRHRHRPQPGRGGLPGGVDRAGVQAGLRRDAHRPDTLADEPGDMVGMQASLIERAADVYWAGAARMTIKADRSVLT